MASDSFESKNKKKKEMIQRIVTSIDTLPLFEKRKTSSWLPNNTYFMSFHLYQSKQKDFGIELDHKFHGNLKEYIRYLGEINSAKASPVVLGRKFKDK
jgi:hypothetical protein